MMYISDYSLAVDFIFLPDSWNNALRFERWPVQSIRNLFLALFVIAETHADV